MEFVKMEGLGNDFVVIDGPYEPTSEQVREWCDRRLGVGADGVLVVTAGEPVVMEYWNADGSAAEMCGNGLRCVARYAVLKGLATRPSFEVATPMGRRRVEVDEKVVRVELGPFSLGREAVELAGYALTPVDVGNPHAVAFVDDCGSVPLSAVGPIVEGDPAFPARTNAEFATVVDRDRIDLRVWERGVGETLACGTGAVAAVAVAHHRGLTEPAATVILPGGPLYVEIEGGAAWITGPARVVFAGAL